MLLFSEKSCLQCFFFFFEKNLHRETQTQKNKKMMNIAWRRQQNVLTNFVVRSAIVLMMMLLLLLQLADACETDFDCRPTSCCHATGCVDTTVAPAPNCTDVLCDTQCVHFTLDCGGRCLCNEKTKVCSTLIRSGVLPPDRRKKNKRK